MTLALWTAQAAGNVDPQDEAATAPGLAGFLDGNGRLTLPKGFSGSLNPAGFRLVSGPGESPRFAPSAAKATLTDDNRRWSPGFALPDGCNGDVSAAVVGDAGEIYFGGEFTLCGDTLANNVVRYAPATGSWSALGSGDGNGVNARVNALAFHEGELYVGGNFTRADAGGEDVSANYVARWNGSAWFALGVPGDGVNDRVDALTVFFGQIYVGGHFTQARTIGEPVLANHIARWNGFQWQGVGGDGGNGVNDAVSALSVWEGELYVGGAFTEANVGGAQVAANRLARWSGGFWREVGVGGGNGVDGFGGRGLPHVYALVAADDGLYVGGSFSIAGGFIPAQGVARWNGHSWSSLAGGVVNAQVNALARSSTGLYVGGVFSEANNDGSISVPVNGIAHWDGSSWTSLGNGGGVGLDNHVSALAVSGGDLYVGGSLTPATADGTPLPVGHIARWNGNAWSALDAGDGNGVNGSVLAMLASGSDLFVGGDFSAVGGVAANNVARWDGERWLAIGTAGGNGVNDIVWALAMSAGDLYVGGEFSTANAGGTPVTVNHVARWNGVNWSALGAGGGNGVNSRVHVLAVSASDLYVGGDFAEANTGGSTISANNVARWDGSAWSALGSAGGNGVDSDVRALAVVNGDVYLGGDFNVANVGGPQVPANHIVRWDGTTWSALGSGAGNGVNGTVSALASTGGHLYAGGSFFEANQGAPVRANCIARWDGSDWTAVGNDGGFGFGGGDSVCEVHALIGSGDDVYAAGNFARVDVGGTSIPAYRIAHWNGSVWSALGSGIAPFSGVLDIDVRALALVEQAKLFAGGRFGDAGGKPAANFACFGLASPCLARVFADGFDR